MWDRVLFDMVLLEVDVGVTWDVASRHSSEKPMLPVESRSLAYRPRTFFSTLQGTKTLPWLKVL